MFNAEESSERAAKIFMSEVMKYMSFPIVWQHNINPHNIDVGIIITYKLLTIVVPSITDIKPKDVAIVLNNPEVKINGVYIISHDVPETSNKHSGYKPTDSDKRSIASMLDKFGDQESPDQELPHKLLEYTFGRKLKFKNGG